MKITRDQFEKFAYRWMIGCMIAVGILFALDITIGVIPHWFIHHQWGCVIFGAIWGAIMVGPIFASAWWRAPNGQ